MKKTIKNKLKGSKTFNQVFAKSFKSPTFKKEYDKERARLKNKGKRVKVPEITIERLLFEGETGELKALDVHNETDGCAYFLEVKSSHYHGFNTIPSQSNRVSKK